MIGSVPTPSAGLPTSPLGKSGVKVSRYCLGCAPLAGLYRPVDAASAAAVLEAAWEGGVRTFDTAPHYGAGLSEVRVGEFLQGKPRESFVLSTKVGMLLVPAENGVHPGSVGEDNLRRVRDYSRDGVLSSLEQSLGRLGLDRVDVALIHDPDEHMPEAIDGAYRALEEMRAMGTVGAIGVGVNHCEVPEQFVRDTDIDCVLVAGRYTLLDDRAARSLLPMAISRGVSFLAAGVFNSGLLADPRPGAPFDYRPASPELLERARALRAITERFGVSLAAAAIQFPLRHKAVAGIVVGTRSASETSQDLEGFAYPIPEDLWQELEASGLVGWQGEIGGRPSELPR